MLSAKDKPTAPSPETLACGSRDVKLDVSVDQSQHPTPLPPDGKALVYLLGDVMHERIGIDGKWVGANHRGTYFFVPIDPGEHHLCVFASVAGHTFLALHALQAKPGDTYYFVPAVMSYGGNWSGRYALEQLDPDEGKYLVSRARFITSRPK